MTVTLQWHLALNEAPFLALAFLTLLGLGLGVSGACSDLRHKHAQQAQYGHTNAGGDSEDAVQDAMLFSPVHTRQCSEVTPNCKHVCRPSCSSPFLGRHESFA